MTDERLAELDAVMAKATARDWYTGDDAAHPANVRIRSNYRSHIAKVYAADMDDHDQAERDATAVVALHNAYADLRAHIDAQAATIARQDEALNIAHTAFADCDQSNPMQVEAIAIVRAALTGAA